MSDSTIITLAIRRSCGKAVFINKHGHVAEETVVGPAIILDKKDPYDVRYSNDGHEVGILDPLCEMSVNRMLTMVVGSDDGQVESFRAEIGFADAFLAPPKLTAAMWMKFSQGMNQGHEFLLGGRSLDISFTLSNFFGLDEKSVNPDTVITVKQDPSAIKFRKSSNVTTWMPLHLLFRDFISSPGAVINWEEGATIYARFCFQMGESNELEPHPTLA